MGGVQREAGAGGAGDLAAAVFGHPEPLVGENDVVGNAVAVGDARSIHGKLVAHPGRSPDDGAPPAERLAVFKASLMTSNRDQESPVSLQTTIERQNSS